MKNSIIFVSAFSVVSIMMVSCASEPQTTTTATHHTTVTRESSPTLTQAPGGTVTMTIILGREIGAQIQAYCPLSDRPGSGDWGADPGEHF